MAKLPKVIRDINRRGFRGFADGGDIQLNDGGVQPSGTKDDPLQYANIPPAQKTTLAPGEQPAVASIVEQPGEIISGSAVQLGADPTMVTSQASISGVEIPSSNAQTAAQYSNYFVNQNTPEAIAAQGSLSQEAIFGDVLGAVSAEAKAQAAQGTVSEKATVRYQLGQLFDSIKEGEELPAWAAGPVRAASALMQKRGLGASSMAAAAITQSIYEAGVPIAAADAKTYATMDLANLTNTQQTALQNAMTYAAMDKANLNSRLQSAVNNAKSFLSMDMANLDSNQKTNILNAQAKLQTLLTDQSQENASRQFNAKSDQQTMEFFSELGVQIDNANATRVAAMRQFNASEENSVLKFKSQMEDSRDKFNSNMQAQINQANANWRRQINTENTARQNEVNRINAQSLLGLSATSQQQLWQRYRDEASFLVQVVENAADRAHSMAEIAQQAGYDKASYDAQFTNTMYAQLGSSTLDGIFDIVSGISGIGRSPTPPVRK